MPDQMLEAHVHSDTSVTLHTVPIPAISGPNNILIRVLTASCNPKDWKMPAGILKTIADCPNSGDDLAGIVHAVGSAVTGLKPGDKVAALHQLGAKYGAYAEYAMVQDFVCFKLPDEGGPRALRWEQAATLPMAVYMASIALFGSLRVCAGPWERVEASTPLLIYGASTGVASMAVKLAQVVGVHPLICVAGSGCEFVGTLIDRSKGDVVFDYRNGDDALIREIKDFLGERTLDYAFDAVSEPQSLANVSKVLNPDGGKLALTLPGRAHHLPDGFKVSHVMAGSLWQKLCGRNEGEQLGNLGLDQGGPEFAREITASIGKLLQDGLIEPHPDQVYEGGLSGLERALKDLREGRVSARRCVVRVTDTPGRLGEDVEIC